ncbi:hypothetical protein NC653_020503 [Populus alba x Populus x berolinensis]|uniref:Uncharacterized protein n=1 Tax=Populus alba x Populus x berolinensis TaxID=444605 RepID=A0AAD6QCI8_9ROSI|nr:hypothetical protein NC653_020503 [Populus alba x Populus x berolinensis]
MKAVSAVGKAGGEKWKSMSAANQTNLPFLFPVLITTLCLSRKRMMVVLTKKTITNILTGPNLKSMAKMTATRVEGRMKMTRTRTMTMTEVACGLI